MNETRRAVLLHIARKHGIEVDSNENIATIKEILIMAAIKSVPAKPAPAPAKPMPPKPGVAKPPAPAAKAAAPAPAKPAPAKPGAPMAAKPAVNGVNGLAKPAAPTAAAAPTRTATAPAASPGVTKADFEALRKEFAAFGESVTQALEQQNQRVTALELLSSGYGKFVSVDASGNIVLDIDSADEETLKDWAYQFEVADHNADGETIRKAMKKLKAAKTFAGWEAKNELPRPAAEDAPAEDAGEEEEEQITEEAINAMNATQLGELADRCGIDRSDKPSPKVLRGRILELLAGGAEEATEEAAEETEEGASLEAGTELIVAYDGTDYPSLFVGYDSDGDFIVENADLGGQVSVKAEMCSFPA